MEAYATKCARAPESEPEPASCATGSSVQCERADDQKGRICSVAEPFAARARAAVLNGPPRGPGIAITLYARPREPEYG